jgi:hypothetical protein
LLDASTCVDRRQVGGVGCYHRRQTQQVRKACSNRYKSSGGPLPSSNLFVLSTPAGDRVSSTDLHHKGGFCAGGGLIHTCVQKAGPLYTAVTSLA